MEKNLEPVSPSLSLSLSLLLPSVRLKNRLFINMTAYYARANSLFFIDRTLRLYDLPFFSASFERNQFENRVKGS